MINSNSMLSQPLNTSAIESLLLPTSVWFKDDFLGGSSLTVTTSTAFGCDIAWTAQQIAGGNQIIAVDSGTWANPGVLKMVTSAVSGQGAALYRGGGTNSAGPLGNLAAQGGWETNFVVQLAQTTLVCLRIGLIGATQQVTDGPSGGIYIEYNTANVGNTDTKFTYVCRSASTSSYSTTGAIDADTSFHHFRIWSTVAGTINFSVDGGTTASISSDVPTVALLPGIQVITRTTAAKTAYIDFFSYMAKNTRT